MAKRLRMTRRGRVRARIWLWKLKGRIATDRLAALLFGAPTKREYRREGRRAWEFRRLQALRLKGSECENCGRDLYTPGLIAHRPLDPGVCYSAWDHPNGSTTSGREAIQ